MNDRLLLVGAYERDNFGDLLFLERAQQYLVGHNSLATVPFDNECFDASTYALVPYTDALRESSARGVIVVGGEVGGTSATSAYTMSCTDELYREFLKAGRLRKIKIVRSSTELSVFCSPYLPRMSRDSSTHEAAAALNSVGLSGLSGLVGTRRFEAWQAVRECSYVSVRDRQSSDLLAKNQISHVLAPDFIHTLLTSPSFRPDVRRNRALIQMKAKVLEQLGVETVASVLSGSKELKNFDLQFFSAGSARGHDSDALYLEVKRLFEKMSPGRRISMPEVGSAQQKAESIAGCGLWVGTSLHGLIISSAFDVPRVGLELEKLVRYAETWGEVMPVGVPIADADAAVASALLARSSAAESGRAAELSQLAHNSMTNAIEAVTNSVPESQMAVRARSSSVRGAILRRGRSLLADSVNFLRL
ncbi:polysaccharide pyruvyl transferase family protein [Rhodococcus sp. SORGH_AS_0303]|uniref:polysaccharide pyruvyl transferase family protein n=1 Tax=Rhodococcus sp. SORGH_AS_0303 TaxID=3041753 RepID=UPI002789E5D3|nr:polysaccharide pyruvyl transferase family protein [Rhodococcus sp. SORGH_AS_0303]MDQ1203314.1 hypothetical protein [Rhodococcus sp. SORGH_AS_0303]